MQLFLNQVALPLCRNRRELLFKDQTLALMARKSFFCCRTKAVQWTITKAKKDCSNSRKQLLKMKVALILSIA